MGDCSKCAGTGRVRPPSPYGRRLSPTDVWFGGWGICSHCNGSGREPEPESESEVIVEPVFQYDLHAS